MTSLTRWDPFREMTSLRDAMNDLFEQAVIRPGFSLASTNLVGQMNVVESEGRYYCEVLLPGVNADSIELTVRQNTLTLKATMPQTLPEQVLKNGTHLLHEFNPGEFTRSITLPKDVDGDKVLARYDRGILFIEVPLAQHAQPKRIAIQGGERVSQQPVGYVEEKAPVAEPATENHVG